MLTKRSALPRKYLRFSLRTFFIAMIVVGGGLGWLGSELVPIRQRQNLLARIKAAGGQVAYQHDGEKGLFVRPPHSRRWLHRFFGDEAFAEIEHVSFFQPLTDGADLSFLEHLPHLKTLVLTGPNVSDAMVARLQQFRELRELCLYETSITANGLAELGRLQSLTLSGADMSDTVLARLDALQSVQSLMLFDTRVTSEGLGPT